MKAFANNSIRQPLLAFSCLLAIVGVCQVANGQLTFEPSWQPPEYAEVRTAVLQWIEQSEASELAQEQARTLWPIEQLQAVDGTTLLSLVAETFSIISPQALDLYQACNTEHLSNLPPDASWLDDQALPKAMRDNLHLFLRPMVSTARSLRRSATCPRRPFH